MTVVIVLVLLWFFLLGSALGAWMAHVRGYEAGYGDGVEDATALRYMFDDIADGLGGSTIEQALEAIRTPYGVRS